MSNLIKGDHKCLKLSFQKLILPFIVLAHLWWVNCGNYFRKKKASKTRVEVKTIMHPYVKTQALRNMTKNEKS